ncbi:MAG: hypothetical protein WDM87_06430 [Terracidiphilus sp.]
MRWTWVDLVDLWTCGPVDLGQTERYLVDLVDLGQTERYLAFQTNGGIST